VFATQRLTLLKDINYT